MADSNISLYEESQQNGIPLECYKFTYANIMYLYTSNRYDVTLKVLNNNVISSERYTADHIKRNSIKPSSQGGVSTVTITVDKDNAVAALFKGSPPSRKVMVDIIRLHDQDQAAYDTVYVGEITQAAFRDSECELTVQLEIWLSRKFPNFMRQFFCCNVVYDESCRLNKSDYEKKIYVDGVSGLTVTSNDLVQYEENFFAGGLMYFNGDVRMIASNKDGTLRMRYPFPTTPLGIVSIYAGCNGLFRQCATRFSNTLNFTGCPYVPPELSHNDKVGKGVYWVDSSVVQRDTDGYVGTIST
jgi:uncharacterized phage protein (TIGR02218 family)